MKIKSFECPKSLRNYERKYLESQTLGQRVVCPIGPANQHIILQIVGFQKTQKKRQNFRYSLGKSMGTLWIGSHMCATQLKRLPGKSFIPRRWVPIFREKFSLKRVWCLKQLLVGLRNLLRGKFSSFTMLSNLKLRL